MDKTPEPPQKTKRALVIEIGIAIVCFIALGVLSLSLHH